MTASALLRRLCDMGVSISVDGDNLVISPASRVPPDVEAPSRKRGRFLTTA